VSFFLDHPFHRARPRVGLGWLRPNKLSGALAISQRTREQALQMRQRLVVKRHQQLYEEHLIGLLAANLQRRRQCDADANSNFNKRTRSTRHAPTVERAATHRSRRLIPRNEGQLLYIQACIMAGSAARQRCVERTSACPRPRNASGDCVVPRRYRRTRRAFNGLENLLVRHGGTGPPPGGVSGRGSPPSAAVVLEGHSNCGAGACESQKDAI